MDNNFNNQNNNGQFNQAQNNMQQPNQPYMQQPNQPYMQGGQFNQAPNNMQGGQPVSGMAITSLVCSIVSVLLLCFFPPVSVILSIVSIVLAAMVMKNNLGGKGLAIAGLVIGIISLLIGAIFAITAIACASAVSELGDYNNFIN